MLIVFSGLPGTGKSTLARMMATRLSSVYLRIDTIEQAIRSSDVLAGEVGPAGYIVAYQIAADNLRVGRSVVADSVNPLQVTRESWVEIAQKSNARLIEVEIICSDETEHRQRIEQRTSDIDGLRLPTWEVVMRLKYEPWRTPPIVIDTAHKTVQEAQDELYRRIIEACSLKPYARGGSEGVD
jgi:predicted kinase